MYGIEEFISQNLDCEDTELPYTMMFFSLNNCDDCIKPEIEWSTFKTAAPSQDWSSRVCLADYTSDGSLRDADMISKYRIDKFPSVLFKNNTTGDAPIMYTGEFTATAFNAYVIDNAIDVASDPPKQFDTIL